MKAITVINGIGFVLLYLLVGLLMACFDGIAWAASLVSRGLRRVQSWGEA